LYHPGGQPCQHHGENIRQRLRTTTPRQGVELLLQGVVFRGATVAWQLLDDRLEVAQLEQRVGGVLAVEVQQLAEQVVVGLAASMREQLPASDHGKGQAAKDLGDLDAQPTRVLAGAVPWGGAGAKVMVALRQVVGGLHQDGAATAVAAATPRTVVTIHWVALIAGRHQAGAAGDRIGVGVERDRSEFASAVGDGDDVDAGDDEQQHVGSLDDAVGEIAFQFENLPVFAEAIVVKGDELAATFAGVSLVGGCLVGPGQELVKGLLATAQLELVGELLQAGEAALADGLGRGGVPGEEQGAGLSSQR
jgi:hypothetical protein